MPTTSATRLRGAACASPRVVGSAVAVWACTQWSWARPNATAARSAVVRAPRGALIGSIFISQACRASAEEPHARAVDEVGVGRIATARSYFERDLPAMVGAVHADVRENVADRACVTLAPGVRVRDRRREILGSDVGQVVLPQSRELAQVRRALVDREVRPYRERRSAL